MKIKISNSCPVCLGDDCHQDRPYQGFHQIFDGKHLMRCSECDMVFADPMPSDEEWNAYNREFFAESLGGMPDNREVELFSQGMALLRLQYIVTSGGYDTLPGSVLEVGPGPGYFYNAYVEQKVDLTRYCAVETDAICRDTLSDLGVEVVEGLEELGANDRFDLAVMSHVLEHSARPRDFLSAVLSFLQPGGGVFIEIPCRDFEYKPVFDAHVLFFDKEPMARLLTDLGVVDFRLSYHGESIVKLKRQLSRKHRALAKAKRLLLGAGSGEAKLLEGDLSVSDPEMARVLAPFLPHIESEKPARWLRVFARKPRDDG
jgi:SAM-dependent methyltransferase